MITKSYGKIVIVALGLAATVLQLTELRAEEMSGEIGVTVESAAAGVAPGFALPTSIQIVPGSPTQVSNCIPFGDNTSYGFTGFIYRNVPAFSLPVGGKIRFDLGAQNDVDTRRNIFFGTANLNPAPPVLSGSDVVSQGVEVDADGWIQVATDAQIPMNPKGNNISGDYELTYTAEATFDFAGGGLLIGFQASPPAAFPDSGCQQVLVRTGAFDISGNFYARWCHRPNLTNGILDLRGACAGTASYLGGFILDDLFIPVDIDLTPEISSSPVGTPHTLTATLMRGLDPEPDVEVIFEVFAGPNAGDGAVDITDINGAATFTYTGDGGVGVDQIEASFINDRGDTVVSDEKLKFWDEDCQDPPNDIPDTCDLDCDEFDGFCDEFAECGGSADDDGNGVPDECNDPPECDKAVADPNELWPPNHMYSDVSVVGVTDPNGDPIAITITSIFQDEPLNSLGDGNTCPDADGVGTDIASVRAERNGFSAGRVYHISFAADDGQGGECSRTVTVCVPHDQGNRSTCVDGETIYDSTVCGGPAPVASAEVTCGLGFELAFLLPPLMWLHGRRRRAL